MIAGNSGKTIEDVEIMAKDWILYKSRIITLNITDGRPLDDVRRIIIIPFNVLCKSKTIVGRLGASEPSLF